MLSRSWKMRWLGFVTGLLGLLTTNHFVLETMHRRLPTGRAQQMLNEPATEVDVVVLGASPAVDAIDAELLGKQIGGTVKHLGARGTGYAEQYLILDLFLRRSSCQTLVFQVDTWGLSPTSYTYPYHEYFYLPFLDDACVAEHLAENYGDWQARCWRWLPMYKYAEFNSEMGVESILKAARSRLQAGSTNRPQRSTKSIPSTVLDSIRAPSFHKEYEWDKQREQSFGRILALATRHNLEIVLCFAPLYHEYSEKEVNGHEVLGYYRQQALANRAKVYECRDHELLEDPDLFHDPKHLNAKGTVAFTTDLAEFLRSTRGPSAKPHSVDARAVYSETPVDAVDAL